VGGRDDDRSGRDRDRPRPRLDRVRDAALVRARADKLRAVELAHADRDWGHSFREHVWPRDDVLARRARTGVNARGQQQGRPPHATRWQSDAAMVIAVDGLRNSADYRINKSNAIARGETQFPVRRPLSEVLGPGWRNDVYGRSMESDGRRPSRWHRDSNAFALWRLQDDGNWHLYTCYPEPDNYRPAGP